MKKKLMVFLVCLCLALGATASITAFAGINTNAPVGDGLIGGGTISSSFVKRNDTNPSAYSTQIGNSTYEMTGVGWHGAVIGTLKNIPKTDVVDGSKFVMKFDVYEMGPIGSQQFWIGALNNQFGSPVKHVNMTPGNTGTIIHAPTSPTVYIGDSEEPATRDTYEGFVGLGYYRNQLVDQQQKGRQYVTFWFEFDVTELSMTFYAGYDDGENTPEKVKCGKLMNAFTIDDTVNSYSWNWGADNNFEFDNYKLYRVKEGADDIVYASADFENGMTIFNTGDGATENDLIVTGSTGTRKVKTYDSLIRVTNPGEDTRLVSRNPLAVDTRIDPSFEMTVSYKLESVAADATRKVGVAFGLAGDSDESKLTEPEDGASFVYLTVADNKVMLGADNIAEDGTATAVGTATELTGATVGGSWITLHFVGKTDGSIDVTVGEQTVNFAGLKLNGNIAFAQTGTGNVTYAIMHGDFNLTGYQLTENEGGKVTTRFDGNTIYSSKFTPQNVTTSAYTEAVPGGHEITGMTPENGKLGFYGSSDNTMISFNKAYADYVLQFDYISIPHGKRGTLTGVVPGHNGIVYSPLYIQFGMDAPISTVLSCYSLGIVEGNGTFYQWGAESLISPVGKLVSEGAKVKAFAGMTKLSEDYDAAVAEYDAPIPVYQTRGADGKYGIDYYGKPNATATAPSFYNKTTRFKFVMINNNFALYAAEVGEDGNIDGDYVKIYDGSVSRSFGYVGLGGGNPLWCEIDNLAITPISKEKAIELGKRAVPAVDLVEDVAAADMDEDPQPTQLAKPTLAVDTANQKVTWTAIPNATDYKVTVGSDAAVTVTGTEFNMSAYTTVGTYTVSVVAMSTQEAFLDSDAAQIDYVVAPGMLTAPRPVADTAAKKVTWTAVENAANYTVTVKLGDETKKTETVTALEFSMAEFEEVGTYEISVKANPAENDKQHTASIGRTEYTVEAQAVAVEYNLDGGVNSAHNPIEFVPGSNVPLLNATKEGYTFGGWFTTAAFEESSKVTALTDAVAAQDGTITLYAKFEKIAATYTITYELDGGNNSQANPTQYVEGVGVPTLGSASKEGFTFKGWFTTATFDEGTQVTSIAADKTGDVTLYAKFEEGEGDDPVETVYTVTYVLNGGNNHAANQAAVLEGATLTLMPATREGYTFVGWFDNEECTGDAVTTVVGTADITLYAKFTKDAQVFTITYVLDGGTNASANPAQVAEGGKITLQSATKEGFTFLGWFTSADFVASSKVTEITVTGDVTLYAQFKDNSSETPIGPGVENPPEEEPKEDDNGCGCGGSVSATMGTAAMLLLCGSAALVARRRKSAK